MKSHYAVVLAVLMLACYATQTAALEAHVLMGTAFVRDGLEGIYVCRMEDGTYERLVEGNADGARFSPDGKKIAYHQGGRLHVMSNDGTNNEQLMPSGCTPGRGEMSYSTNGIFWSTNAVIQRYRFDTQEHEILYDVNTLGTSTEHTHKDQGFWVSRDGYKGFLYVHLEDETLPIVEFNSDFSDATFKYTAVWGHGNTVTPNGAYVLMNWWETGHTSFRVWSIEENRQVGTTDCGHRIVNWSSVENCANSDDWAVIRTDDLHLYVIDWAHDQAAIMVVTPNVTESGGVGKRPGNMWLGALPLPVDGPHLAIDRTELHFTAAESQDVVVTNAGTPTLSTLTIGVTPASAWLTTGVAGEGTDTQTITTTVNPAGLSDGVYEADVAVSGGGADNTVTYHVVLAVGAALAPPSNVQAEETGTDLTDVALTWTDNTSFETGFVIERKSEGGAWEIVTTTAADAEGYTDVDRPYGVYLYRIKADAGWIESGYSDEATVTVQGLPWITVTGPTAGQTFTGGQTVIIQWDANLVPVAEVTYSLDGGESWEPISDTGGINMGDPTWGNLEWTVPEQATTALWLRVNDYGVKTPVAQVGPFTVVVDTNAVVVPKAAWGAGRTVLSACGGSNGIVAHPCLNADQHARLEIFSFAGALIHRRDLARGSDSRVSAAIPHGTYLVKLSVFGAGNSAEVLTQTAVCR